MSEPHYSRPWPYSDAARPIHWGGDFDAPPPSLAETARIAGAEHVTWNQDHRAGAPAIDHAQPTTADVLAALNRWAAAHHYLMRPRVSRDGRTTMPDNRALASLLTKWETERESLITDAVRTRIGGAS